MSDTPGVKFFHGLVNGLVLAVLLWTALVVGCVALSGCAGPLIKPQAECETCIGPYDVTLRSHREALD